MGNVLAFCETSGSSLRSNALANIAFARLAAAAHGGDVIVALIGGDASAAADAARYAGKVVAVADGAVRSYLAETYAPVVARLAGEHAATLVSATASNLGKDLMPRVAALLDAGMASEVIKLEARNQFVRPVLAGNAFSTIEVSSPIMCATVRQTAFAPAAASDPGGGTGEIIHAAAGPINALGAEVLRTESQKSDRPELTDAKIVVSGGRGMKSGENFKILEQLADLLGAAMGASRAATDAGMVPADWQVGQTGKIVAPSLYFAVAISGAIQHLAGMKGSKTIVAINKDAEAPIFQVADYGVVTTWEKAIPELIEEIKKLNDCDR